MTILRSFWKKFPNPSKCCRWIPCPNCILKAKAIFLFELYFSKLKVLSCCRHLCKYFSKEFGHLLNWISAAIRKIGIYFGEEKKILELCFPIQGQKYLLHKVNKRYSASKLLKITWWTTCGKLKASNKAFCQTWSKNIQSPKHHNSKVGQRNILNVGESRSQYWWERMMKKLPMVMRWVLILALLPNCYFSLW